MISQTARLNRLFCQDQKCLVVALDHGSIAEPRASQGLEDLATMVRVVAQSLPDAILLSPGQMHWLQEIPGRSKPSLVVRADVDQPLLGPRSRSPLLQSPEGALEQPVRADAVCVAANLCSNLPREMFMTESASASEAPATGYQNILAGTVGRENSSGTVVGRLRPSPFTFCRVSTDEMNGRILAYVGEGTLTNDALRTFGAYGVVQIRRLQKLLRYICENGFEHHVAINLSRSAWAVKEALSKYLGWGVYNQTAADQGM